MGEPDEQDLNEMADGWPESISVPLDVQPCPYCGTQLSAACEEMTQEPDGLWYIAGIAIECPKEDPENWNDHSELPYENWFPAQMKITGWWRGLVGGVEQIDE